MPILPDATYTIINKSSNHLLSAPAATGASLTADVPAVQPNFNQNWKLVSDDSGELFFIKAISPEVYAFAKAPNFGGQKVSASLDVQRWVIKSGGHGFYTIGLQNSDLVWQFLSDDKGSGLTLGPNTGVDSQKWSFKST